jgi:hypothetical protein
MSFVFAQVFVFENVLKLFFALIIVIAHFGNAATLFIINYLFFLSLKVVGYLPNLLPHVFK